jgi:Glycosyltransferase 61/Glycosyl transferase family 2
VAEPKHNVSIMACARGETAYVTEWLLYHQAIGFDHVYLYCNDDDPADLYAEILPFCRGNAPFVTFHHLPFRGQQFHMMMHALRHHKDASQWVAFLDIDEFLALPGLDDVQKLVRQCPANWDSIHLNRSLFGNNGHADIPSGSVLRNYTRREDRVHHTTKTLTRTAKIDLARITPALPFWRAWNGVFGPEFIAVNVLGERMHLVTGTDDGATYVRPGEVQIRIRSIAVVNHYALKSARDYELRLDQAVQFDGDVGMTTGDFIDAVRTDAALKRLNAVEDAYLASYWARTLGECQRRRMVPRSHLPNVARGKRALQSSLPGWLRDRTPEDVAAGALGGTITGDAHSHTDLEPRPWWMVDLGTRHLIYEIRVYNAVNDPALKARLGAFHIDAAGAADDWATIHAHDGSKPIGGADGDPLILRFHAPLILRRMRIIADGPTYLHLDQVELYGVPTDDADPATDPITHVEPAAPDRHIVVASLADLIGSDGQAPSRRVEFQHVTRVVPAGRYERRTAEYLDTRDLADPLTRYYNSLMVQKRQEYPDLYHVGLPNAVVTGQGTVVTADGTAIRDSCWEFFAQGGVPPGLSASAPGVYQLDRQPTRHIERPSLLLKRPFWRNYIHFMCDAAMLLALLPDLDMPPDWQLVIGLEHDAGVRAYMSEVLNALAPGIPIIEHADHDVWSFASLQYVMPVQLSPLIKLPRAMSQLRAAMLTGQVRPPQRRRIYLLRGEGWRRLENEAEVVELARRYDFETVRPEQYPVRQQAALFQSAECVMGVKGAGLGNLLFCSATASVVVLSPSDLPDPFYWDIAGQLGIAYRELFGPLIDTSGHQGTNPFRVDLDRLDRLLAEMCRSARGNPPSAPAT